MSTRGCSCGGAHEVVETGNAGQVEKKGKRFDDISPNTILYFYFCPCRTTFSWKTSKELLLSSNELVVFWLLCVGNCPSYDFRLAVKPMCQLKYVMSCLLFRLLISQWTRERDYVICSTNPLANSNKDVCLVSYWKSKECMSSENRILTSLRKMWVC